MKQIRLGLALLLFTGGTAHGASALRLPVPDHFGHVTAFTYDSHGQRNGTAELGLTRATAGDVLLAVDVHLDSGAQTHLRARMALVEHGQALRPLTERSWSRDPHGALIAAMDIDHEKRVATCTDARQQTHSIDLPRQDRVVNVPLNLFLEPLIVGQAKAAHFQTLACGRDIRLVDTEAQVVARTPAMHGAGTFVHVRCTFKLGPVLSMLAGPFLPKLEFWFDVGGPDSWIAYRAPLYANGPDLLLLRQSVRPAALRTDASDTREISG